MASAMYVGGVVEVKASVNVFCMMSSKKKKKKFYFKYVYVFDCSANKKGT